jgi:glutamate-5-semialdehyde dehydrogenase
MKSQVSHHQSMIELGQAARIAASELARAQAVTKNNALLAMAEAIERNATHILHANEKDMALAVQKGLSQAFLDRLSLDPKRVQAMVAGIKSIATLPDPVGKILVQMKRPNGLVINRISVPIGVIGVIYESRPNVTADAAALCLKAGNAVILRGGSESFHSSAAILRAIHEGLSASDLPTQVIQMVPSADRAAVNEMLKLDHYIDVIIPRGGPKLIEHISAHTHIPLFKHLAGLCHTYIHQAADLEMAKKVLLNAKMRRTGICGATEVLLIDKAIVATHLSPLLNTLLAAGCEIRGDESVKKINSQVKLSHEQDFLTEFLDAIIAVKIVDNITAAIDHIAKHGTQHTEAIITADKTAAEKFLQEVDSAIVMHNASTQFADGGEFGMGAEIGIATGKMHARGPVGVEQLTTFKYQVRGNGQTRA